MTKGHRYERPGGPIIGSAHMDRFAFRRSALAAALTAISLITSAGIGVPEVRAQQNDPEERLNRIKYGSDYYDKYREITYWGIADLRISDHRYGTGDAERLKLVVKDKTFEYRRLPAPEVREHFLKEFRRLFSDVPFNDLEVGRDERWAKFSAENRKLMEGSGSEFRERWQASEQARRRALYGGRAGAIYCDISVKRQEFPIVYTSACVISADDDLRPYFPHKPEMGADIGFSSPEHIAGEIKRTLSELLKELSSEMRKIRKYGKRE
jgi:hypothetical protein